MTAQLWGNVIFDYLNNNRHKFDDHGNFDSTSDPRDFLPFLLGSKYGKAPKPKRGVTGLYPPGQGPDDIAQERNKYALQDFENGIRYDRTKCDDNWEIERKLCKDGNYSSGCWDRARDRHSNCTRLGHYNGLPIWTFQDETGQPQGDLDPDRRRKKVEENPQPQPSPKPEDRSDEAKRAIAGGATDSMLTLHPFLLQYLAATEFARGLRDGPANVDPLLRSLVLLPSDYPKHMMPLSKYSPPPHLLSALGALMGPRGLPLGGPAPR